jgi:hypothetical protein
MAAAHGSSTCQQQRQQLIMLWGQSQIAQQPHSISAAYALAYAHVELWVARVTQAKQCVAQARQAARLQALAHEQSPESARVVWHIAL